MRRTPKKHGTEDALYAAALRALTRRAYSVHEMRKWLAQRADEKTIAEAVLARLKDHRYLDDARYARQYARNRTESRRQGRFRIARDLRARGVPDRHIEPAIEEAFTESDESAMLRKRIERKLRLQRGPLDQRRLASLYGSLLRAGFPSDLIRRELRAVTKHTAALPDVEPAETTDEHG